MKARAIVAIVLALGLLGAALWLATSQVEAPAVGDAGVASDAGVADAGVDALIVLAPPAEPAAPVAAPINGPPGSSIALAIEPDAAERVVVLAQRIVYGSVYALVTVDRSELNEEEPDDEELDDEGPCESDEESDDARCDCLRASAPNIDAGWLAALGRPAVRYELVRLEHTDAYRVLARVPLTEPVLIDDIEGIELRANDMDGDGRTELTAIFSLTVPDCDTFQEDGGTLGAIFDASDLHLQAAFVREASGAGGDSDVNSESSETVWRAVDENGDGHPDLRVRTTTRSSSSDPPDYETHEHDTSATAVCPYDLTTDRWLCPEGALPVPPWFAIVAPALTR